MPDITPLLKLGLVGFLCAIILLMLVFGIRLMPVLLNLIAPKNENGKREAIRELRAGEKDVEFWIKQYDDANERQTRILLDNVGKIRARARQIDERLALHEQQAMARFDNMEKHIARAVAEISRQIRDKRI